METADQFGDCCHPDGFKSSDHEHGMSFYLCKFSFISTVLYSFQVLVKFISKYFVHFDNIINETLPFFFN